MLWETLNHRSYSFFDLDLAVLCPLHYCLPIILSPNPQILFHADFSVDFPAQLSQFISSLFLFYRLLLLGTEPLTEFFSMAGGYQALLGDRVFLTTILLEHLNINFTKISCNTPVARSAQPWIIHNCFIFSGCKWIVYL